MKYVSQLNKVYAGILCHLKINKIFSSRLCNKWDSLKFVSSKIREKLDL